MISTLRHICGEIVHRDEQNRYHIRSDRACVMHEILSCPNCPYPLTEGWFRPLYRVEPMSRGMMERTISGNYACSNCWGYAFTVLNVFHWEDGAPEQTEPLYLVLCATCREETLGFVSTVYVERSRDEDFIHSIDVAETLGPVMGVEQLKEERRSTEQNIRELGFL